MQFYVHQMLRKHYISRFDLFPIETKRIKLVPQYSSRDLIHEFFDEETNSVGEFETTALQIVRSKQLVVSLWMSLSLISYTPHTF